VLEVAADPYRWQRSLEVLDGDGVPVCRRSPETGEDDQRTSGMTISEVRVLLSS
jgi:hypothetical protein